MPRHSEIEPTENRFTADEYNRRDMRTHGVAPSLMGTGETDRPTERRNAVHLVDESEE